MVHHLFPDFVETGVLGQIRDITVHFPIDLNAFHDFLAVSFQSAVEIVQVFDAADLAGGGVEQFGRDGFGQRVISFLLVPRHQVESVRHDHAVKLRNLVGGVLKVGIHGDDHVTLRFLEAAIQGRAFSVVTAEFDAFHATVLFLQIFNQLPRTVGAAVIDENDFVCEAVCVHYAFNP